MDRDNREMTTKTYFVRRLDCANCAAKMEAGIRRMPEVEDASLTFVTGLLQVTASGDEDLKDRLEEVCRSIEREVYLEEKGVHAQSGHAHRHAHGGHEAHGHDHEHGHDHDHDDGCCCDHDHGHDHKDDDCCCGHDHDHDDDHDDGCCCDHDHDHDHDDDCCCGHDHDHDVDDDCCCDHDHHREEAGRHQPEHAEGMVSRTYLVQNLGCANCAAKMEAGINRMPEVGDARLTFATKKLQVTAEDPDALKDKIESFCRSIEKDVYLEESPARGAGARQEAADRRDGEEQEPEGQSFYRRYARELNPIIIGAVIFAAGMILHHVNAGGHPVLDGWAALAVFGIGYIVTGASVLRTAGHNLLHGQVFDENFLMSIATLAAFAIGEYPEAMGVMLFYRIGELFEDIAVDRSREQIMEAVDMRPETVLLADGGHTHEIPAEEAAAGDIIMVRPGDRIPLDGIVLEGESRIDTSPVTGEPVPVAAGPGSDVISGCVNENGLLKVRVTKPLEESMVTRILDSVENAAAGKPKIDRFITRFARVYTPIVVALAVLLAIVPSLVTGNWMYWITTAITFLVISCPCALVISVPLAFFSGIGAGSKKGILFKGGASIEALARVRAVVLDKTGTITEGNFKVQTIDAENGFTEDELLQMAAACESASTHPIAGSIREEAAERGLAELAPDSIEEISGRGIHAVIGGRQVLCGNAKLMSDRDVPLDGLCPAGSGTTVIIAVDGVPAGIIKVADTIKADAAAGVAGIRRKGLVPAMLTGDAWESAKDVADQVGIDRVFAQLLPDGKLDALKALRGELGGVMFVGDGINDAPVLAGADVGAAMGSGADAAIEAADVVFMNSRVESVPEAIDIAKTTGAIAWENVVFALAVKLIVMVLGIAGFANIWAAVFADTGVAILCILNSLRILMKRF